MKHMSEAEWEHDVELKSRTNMHNDANKGKIYSSWLIQTFADNSGKPQPGMDRSTMTQHESHARGMQLKWATKPLVEAHVTQNEHFPQQAQAEYKSRK